MTALCVMGEECIAFDRTSKVPAPVVGRHLCAACELHYRRAVTLLVYDYVDLSQLIARRDGHSDVKISRPKPTSIPPIDLGIDALRAEIVTVLLVWEYDIRRAAGLRWRLPSNARAGYNVQAAAAVVAPRVDLLAGLGEVGGWETGVQALTRLAGLHQRARRATGLTDPAIRLPGDCPTCTVPSLIRSAGEDTVWCATCAGVWPYAEYRLWVSMMIRPENLPTQP